jgi:hypothetical protein
MLSGQVNLELFTKMNTQMSDLWEIVIYDLQSIDNKFHYRVLDTNLPFFKIEYDTVNNGYSYPKGISFDNEIQIGFYEDEKFTGYNFAYDWIAKQYNFEKRCWKNCELSDVYKQGELLFFGMLKDSQGTRNYYPTQKFILEDLQIIGVENFALNRTTGTPLEEKLRLKVGSYRKV